MTGWIPIPENVRSACFYSGETGIKSLYCTLDCCNIDFSPECTYRSSHLDMFPVQMTFAQAFDQPPVVMVTASVNFEIIGKLIPCMRQ